MAKSRIRPTPQSVPAARALDSARVLLERIQPGWRKAQTAADLLDEAVAAIKQWTSGTDEPLGHLQRGVTLALLGLELALSGQGPPVQPQAEEASVP